MRDRFGTMLLAICMVLATPGCSRPARPDAAASAGGETVTTVSTGGGRVIQEVRKGLGVACRVYGQPVSITGDYSYLVSDIGRPGVPLPSTREMETINRIKKRVHSKDLRFEYLGRQFMVYDATLGPCETGIPGYQVLNEPGCNIYYSPTDDFDSPKAVPNSTCTPEPSNTKSRLK